MRWDRPVWLLMTTPAAGSMEATVTRAVPRRP